MKSHACRSGNDTVTWLREPNTDLLANRPPLTSEKRKSGRHGTFKDTQEESYSHCASEILDCSHTAERQPPHDDVEGRVFGQREPLQEAICWPLKGKITEIEHGGNPAVVLA
jgi:hypothetical protein